MRNGLARCYQRRKLTVRRTPWEWGVTMNPHPRHPRSALVAAFRSSSSTSNPPPPPSPPSSSGRRGLFNIPQLTSPDQFAVLAQQAMATGDALRQSLDPTHHPATTVHDARRRLYRLDAISRTVCNVIDAAELCRQVHVDAAWRRAADDTFATLSRYIADLNGDERLYRATRAVADSDAATVQSQLTEEEKRLTASLREEFERDGIHLQDADTRRAVRDHQGHILALESQFQQNLVTWQRHFAASQTDVHAVLPPAACQALGLTTVAPNDDDHNSAATTTTTLVQLPADAHILPTLIKYSPSPALRRQVYLEYTAAVPDNCGILHALRQERHALAQRLGYASHGDRYLRDKMVARPAAVDHFLQTVTQSTQAAWKADMATLSRAKAHVEGNPTLEAWDVSYYTALCKRRSRRQAGVAPHGTEGGDDGMEAAQQLSQYLTLEQTMESIKVLCQRLFGVTVQEVPTTVDERWDGTVDPDGGGIRRLDLAHHETGQSLGILYLDLYPRPGKYGHAAHFTVRCGCVTNGEEVVEAAVAAAARRDDPGGTSSSTSTTTIPEEPSWEYQLPVVALVCNLSSDRGTLTHGEVETVFHELGHAMHSLLSRTQFQHLSGTRAAMDFVETPSQLFENYVWDADFLRILCRDPVTGATIPDSLIQSLQRSRFDFTSIERRTQIIYAKFDQRLFSHPGTDDAYDIFSGLHEELGMPFAKGTHWYSRFGHLITYASGYYGYLFSSVFARDIWQRHLEGRSLSSSQGQILWKKMLIHGGARDPNAILADLNS